MPANDKLITIFFIIFAILLFWAGTKLYNISLKEIFNNKNFYIVSPTYDFSITVDKKFLDKKEKVSSEFIYELEQKLILSKKSKNEIYDIISRIYLQNQLAQFFNRKIDYVISKNSWELTYFDLSNLKFFMPIEDGILVYNEYYYPGALRRYRNGIHQGIDISYTKQGIKLGKGAPIYSISDGIIVKITDYEYFSRQKDYFELLSICANQKYTDDKYLDLFRGKQVQVKYDNFLILYCHLDDFNKKLKVGMKVEKGTLIGYMGNSGVEYIGSSDHLHLEIYLNNFIIGVNRERQNFDYQYELLSFLFRE